MVGRGPAQPVHQDPRGPAGAPGDHRVPGRGHQHQRDADLLAGPLPQVMTAFLDGMEQARRAGQDVRGLASVASFFVSRVDTEVDARLDKIGTGEAKRLRGRPRWPTPGSPTSATSRCSPGDRWRALAAAGARPQRPLWASTSTKDPAYPGHPLRGRPGRPGCGEHHAGGDVAVRWPTTARSRLTPSTAPTRRPMKCSSGWPPRGGLRRRRQPNWKSTASASSTRPGATSRASWTPP